LSLGGIGMACGSAMHQHLAAPWTMPHPTDAPQPGHSSMMSILRRSSLSERIILFQPPANPFWHDATACRLASVSSARASRKCSAYLFSLARTAPLAEDFLIQFARHPGGAFDGMRPAVPALAVAGF
jgi:hypothetical protein